MKTKPKLNRIQIDMHSTTEELNYLISHGTIVGSTALYYLIGELRGTLPSWEPNDIDIIPHAGTRSLAMVIYEADREELGTLDIDISTYPDVPSLDMVIKLGKIQALILNEGNTLDDYINDVDLTCCQVLLREDSDGNAFLEYTDEAADSINKGVLGIRRNGNDTSQRVIKYLDRLRG